HLHLVERRVPKRVEHVGLGRVDRVRGPLARDELLEVVPVGLSRLGRERREPRGVEVRGQRVRGRRLVCVWYWRVRGLEEGRGGVGLLLPFAHREPRYGWWEYCTRPRFAGQCEVPHERWTAGKWCTL